MNTSQPPFVAGLARLTQVLPSYPGSALAAQVLNRVLLPHLPADTLTMLEGRPLRLAACDLGTGIDFTYRDGRFRALSPAGKVDLEISATLHDFWRIARREEDPDTLFFNRRLRMEGDTELGLMVKNTLDALDPSVLDPVQWLPAPAAKLSALWRHRALGKSQQGAGHQQGGRYGQADGQ